MKREGQRGFLKNPQSFNLLSVVGDRDSCEGDFSLHPFQVVGAVSLNKHATDLPNALLNYSYACLQTYVKRAINSIGLDNSIPFLHDLTPSRGLVFDIMELWRTNCDYSVLQTLEQLKLAKEKTQYFTDGFEIVLDSKTIDLLFEKLRFNLFTRRNSPEL